MLSYQHAYHAGGPADVIKHTLWAHVLTHLMRKEGALHIHETHAGRGIYPVAAPETQKTPEYLDGLARVLLGPSEDPYLAAAASLSSPPTFGKKITMIPGSPAVAASLLRPGDHLHLVEAHPAEIEHLYESFPHHLRREKNIHIHHTDGHGHIAALLRASNRNAVLVDPSFEVKSEYLQTVETVKSLLEKSPRATIMVWYPLLSQKKNSQALIEALKDLGVPATYLVHYSWDTPDAPGMHGTGQIILNLPYKLESELPKVLKPLAEKLKQRTAQLTSTMLVPRA